MPPHGWVWLLRPLMRDVRTVRSVSVVERFRYVAELRRHGVRWLLDHRGNSQLLGLHVLPEIRRYSPVSVLYVSRRHISETRRDRCFRAALIAGFSDTWDG